MKSLQAELRRKRVCVVTGSRAEYGLLKHVIENINLSSKLHLQLVVTGSHLSPEFGMTVNEILDDKFHIDKRVESLLSSDSSSSVTKSMGLTMISFADVFNDLKPDLLLLLGDRFEIFSVCAAALIAKIPVAHCHGGEITEGAFDDALRHSITKMSHLHFVATDAYKRRVMQLGEEERNVFTVGGLGVDAISKINLLTKQQVEQDLGVNLTSKSLLVSFHPVTLENERSECQFTYLLNALSRLDDVTIIFTLPNADTEGRSLINMTNEFCSVHHNAKAFASLGQVRYLSCLKYVSAVVGNSSSGLLEAPSLETRTINIGTRQSGRLKAKSVLDCTTEEDSIFNALIKVLYPDKEENDFFHNPYGNGGASEAIVSYLEKIEFHSLLKKKFVDIE